MAVPSMLMVAPRGRVKEYTPLETPIFSSATSMVTGRVPPLLRVTKAVTMASRALARNFRKLIRKADISPP